jgi:hypothetical protein
MFCELIVTGDLLRVSATNVRRDSLQIQLVSNFLILLDCGHCHKAKMAKKCPALSW